MTRSNPHPRRSSTTSRRHIMGAMIVAGLTSLASPPRSAAATLELQLAALLINPRGDVGGQLYRHEVEMLDAAIRRLRARGQN